MVNICWPVMLWVLKAPWRFSTTLACTLAVPDGLNGLRDEGDWGAKQRVSSLYSSPGRPGHVEQLGRNLTYFFFLVKIFIYLDCFDLLGLLLAGSAWWKIFWLMTYVATLLPLALAVLGTVCLTLTRQKANLSVSCVSGVRLVHKSRLSLLKPDMGRDNKMRTNRKVLCQEVLMIWLCCDCPSFRCCCHCCCL